MAGTPDILLSIGVDISPLRDAKNQINKELSSLTSSRQLSFIKPGQIGLLDAQGRAIAQVGKNIRDLETGTKGASKDFLELIKSASGWAIMWTALYGGLRSGIKEIDNLIASLESLNSAVDLTRAAADEMGATFDAKFSTIKDRIIDVTAAGIVPLKDMAESFKVLSFEGLNAGEALSALGDVRALATITDEKAKKVAEALAEVYGLFKDTLKGAGDEQEKLTYITNLMAGTYAKANVSVADFHKTIAKVGVAAKELGIDLEYLAKMIVWLDANMVGGRLSSAQLRESFVEIMGDTQKLNKIFGTAVTDLDLYFVRIIKLQQAIKSLSEVETRAKALKLFPDINQAETFIKLLREEATLSGVSALNEAKILEAQKIKAHDIAAGANKMRASAAGFFKDLGNWYQKTFVDPKYLKDLEKAKQLFEQPEKADRVSKYEREYLQMIYEEYKAKELALEQTKKFRAEEAAGNLERKASLEAALKSSKELRAEQIKINEEGRKGLATLAQEAEISLLEAAGVDKRRIAQEKINNLIISTSDRISDAGLRAAARENLRLASAQELSEAYKIATVALGDQASALEFVNKLSAERNVIMQESVAEIRAFADELRGITVDFTKDLMSGTADVKNMLASLSSAYQGQFAASIGNMISDTGFFSGMAEAFISPLEKARTSLYEGVLNGSVEGSRLFYDAIVSASSGGSYSGGGVAVPSGNKGTAVGGMLAGLSALTGFGAGTADVAGLGKVKTAPADYYKTQAASTAATSKLAQVMSSAGQVAGVGMGLYSGYQGVMSQKGQGAGMGAAGGFLSGMSAGAVFGPVGMIAGGIIGGVMGAIQGKKGNAGPAPQATSYRIESQIKLSNNFLNAISRSTAAIARGQEKYLSVATQSAYFQESPGIEGRFARDVLRA